MTLTREHLMLLSAPFKPDEHEFKPPRGYVYIAETAICERIESVDPSWEWRIEPPSRNDMKGALATTIGHLTILGVTRGGAGQQAVEFQKGSDTESGEAEKGSETDALKRAARKFGIGRYLLDCPKDVTKHGAEFNRWLNSLRAPKAPEPAPRAETPQNGVHWSFEDGAMKRVYEWANDAHGMSEADVTKAIVKSGRLITALTKAELKDIISKDDR